MELHLKQWRNQHESEHQPPPQAPPLSGGSSVTATALPLFVHEQQPNSTKLTSCNLSDLTSRFPNMGSYFSMAQWQELELQALIYRYMLAGATVPPQLLQHVKKSLLHSASPYFLYHHYQPALLQSGYWGRGAMDPEPGRCRRTDGKKWRCSRDVVAGQKYCERHVHRGRNRSRKPVENNTQIGSGITTTNTSSIPAGGGVHGGGGGAIRTGSQTAHVVGNRPPSLGYTGQSSSSSIDLLHLNQSPSDSNKALFGEVGAKSDGHILRHFFDDWPKPIQDRDNNNNGSSMNSATCLSISMPGNSSSDVSLKLSTGNLDEVNGHKEDRTSCEREEQPLINWAGGWATAQVASMGGPLAEALRSSTSSTCPTSVLHQLPRGSASEGGYVTT